MATVMFPGQVLKKKALLIKKKYAWLSTESCSDYSA